MYSFKTQAGIGCEILSLFTSIRELSGSNPTLRLAFCTRYYQMLNRPVPINIFPLEPAQASTRGGATGLGTPGLGLEPGCVGACPGSDGAPGPSGGAGPSGAVGTSGPLTVAFAPG